MHMVRIAICDDEIAICNDMKQTLSIILKQMHEDFQIVCYTNPKVLLHTNDKFDLIYLDIQMPDLDGITLAKKIREQNADCILIFITVLKEYMLDAFEVEAIDYICKPIEKKRLERSCKRAIKRIKKENEQKIFVQTVNWCKSIPMHRIYYCEVINRKIYLHTKDGIIDYYGTLEDIEKQLDCRFFRCHRSYIVNIDYLQSYMNGEIVLENAEKVPVSRLRHKAFMQKMLAYMKKGE